MYNPYENNNKPSEGGINTPQAEQPQNQHGANGQTQQQATNSPNSYSWGNTQAGQNTGTIYTRPPVTYPAAPPPKKKSKAGMRILTLVLCCLLASALSVGGFVALIQTGVVNIENGEGNAAFTINKVTGSVQPTTGEVGVLSRQEISKKVIPSVVCIQNFQISNQYGMFGTGANNSEVSPAGEGSGIIMSEDGYIITNAHVVEGATSLKVVLSDGNTYEAQLIGSDTVTDLAVLKIDATGLTPAEFGSSEDLSVADEVIAIGNPGGMTFNSSVTIGYVSALNREITTSSGNAEYTMNCIQTDAAINPGNSGGALVNQYGQVIGINSAKFVANGYEGLGFSIPIDTAQPIISDLKQYGYVKDRAVLGISGQYIDEMTARFHGLSAGMYVGEVTSRLAQSAGIKEADVITAIDGVQVSSTGTISSVLATKKPGETVALTVDRATDGTQGMTIQVTLSEYEPDTTSVAQ